MASMSALSVTALATTWILPNLPPSLSTRKTRTSRMTRRIRDAPVSDESS